MKRFEEYSGSDNVIYVAFLFAVSALIWNMPNLGGALTPRNFMGWFGLILVSVIIFSISVRNRRLLFSKSLYLLFIPPAAILLHGFLIPPSENMFYYIWLSAGCTFAFSIYILALLQVSENSLVWLRVSNVLLLVVLFQLLMSEIIPLTPFADFVSYILPIELQATYGGFQQPNLMASFAATVILWSWALRIKFEKKLNKSWVVFIVCIFMLSFFVFQSGSRTGSIGLIVGSLFLIFSSWNSSAWSKSKWVLIAIFLALLIEYLKFFPSLQQADGGLEGISNLGLDDKNTTIRVMFLFVSFFAGLENWAFGHGLGTFSETFYNSYLGLKNDNPEWGFVGGLMHPHNELLMQWVELGIYGIVLVVLPYVMILLRLTFANSFNLFLTIGVSFPIFFHSQTETVLHVSGAHWFLFGLAFVSLIKRDFLSELILNRVVLSVPISLGLIGIYISIDAALMAQKAWNNNNFYKKAKNIDQFVQRVMAGDELNHWIHGKKAKDSAVRTLMTYAIYNKDKKAIRNLQPRLFDNANRVQSRVLWSLVAESFLASGDLKSYNKYLHVIRKFDPKYAEILNKKFNVTQQ